MPTWDPAAYARFGDERRRPFDDLLARVRPERDPRVVVDLGCGTGALTATLLDRWPSASVTGVDSSAEMVAAAVTCPGLSVVKGDLRDWRPDGPVDVLVTNATLQWVPGHLELLPRWVDHLAPGGRLALQVPGNFAAPSHALMRETAADGPWADRLAGVLRHDDPVADPSTYAEVLAGAGCVADVWETTYVHVLDPAGEHGDDAVLAWVSGTGLRPVLDALADDPDLRDAYVEAYRQRLRAAYPRRPWGTPLPFRRLFAVGHKAA